MLIDLFCIALALLDKIKFTVELWKEYNVKPLKVVFKGPVYWTANLTETGLDWTEKWTGLQSQSRPVLDQSSLQSMGF